MIAKTIRDMNLLIALKPTKVKNDVEAKFTQNSGKLQVVSTRYRTRVMMTSGQQVDSLAYLFHSNTLTDAYVRLCI